MEYATDEASTSPQKEPVSPELAQGPALRDDEQSSASPKTSNTSPEGRSQQGRPRYNGRDTFEDEELFLSFQESDSPKNSPSESFDSAYESWKTSMHTRTEDLRHNDSVPKPNSSEIDSTQKWSHLREENSKSNSNEAQTTPTDAPFEHLINLLKSASQQDELGIVCDERRPECGNCMKRAGKCKGYILRRNAEYSAADPSRVDSKKPETTGKYQVDAGNTEFVDPSKLAVSYIRTRSYIITIAKVLFDGIGAGELDYLTVERLSAVLPTLLRASLLIFQCEVPSWELTEVSHFIDGYGNAAASDVATFFKDNYCQTNKLDEDMITRELQSTEIMNWRRTSREFERRREKDSEDYLAGGGPGTPEHRPRKIRDSDIPALEHYKEFVSRNPWILGRLRGEITLSRGEPDTLNDIWETMERQISFANLVGARHLSIAQTIYTIDWDVLEFLRGQDYDTSDADVLDNIITLTGSRIDAQALSCRDYMEQAWPSTGLQTLQLIREILRNEEHRSKLVCGYNLLDHIPRGIRTHTVIVNTPTKLTLDGSINNESVVVKASGTPGSVMEVGEQLAWLGAALRFSALNSRAVHSILSLPEDSLSAGDQKRVQGWTRRLIWHADVEVSQLGKYRHVLGWCADTISVVGTTQAVYGVGKSKLPKAQSGCVLEKAEISGGQFVTGTAAFTLGNRENPVHISRFGYFTKLEWISSKHFVFWDEETKRGWLVNGASALLHILRASLNHSEHKFKSAWLLDPNSLGDIAGSSQSESALKVLTDQRNRDLKLYLDKSEVYDEEEMRDGQASSIVSRRQTRYYRLEDRIEHIYNILEKLIDHQTDAERRSGLQINPWPRRQLEGWDFKDLVTGGDPFFPRVATLDTTGKGWVGFARAIHAVTLLGRDFGELIQPRLERISVCPRWSLLPSKGYYLAASVSDLQDIMRDNDCSHSNPRQLCDNIVWHIKQSTFDPCPCRGVTDGKHHDPVQVLFPLSFLQKLKKKPHVELKDQGAVIFGYSMNLRWYYQDSGDPVKGDPPQELDVTVATRTPEDSGIGSSIDSDSRSVSGPSSAISTASDTPSSSNQASPSGGLQEKISKASKRNLGHFVWSINKKVKS
ncbi:hypothetical protein AAE478_000172 [Parahypoxylon ruwenzoriense]